MDFRKALLKAASVLALTAAGQTAADAAIGPEASGPTKASAPSYGYADPLFELLTRTNGSWETMDDALREMFSGADVTQVTQIPGLLANLSAMGVPSRALSRSRDVLIELVLANPNLDGDVRDAVVRQVTAGSTGYQLAQRRRDPGEVGQAS